MAQLVLAFTEVPRKLTPIESFSSLFTSCSAPPTRPERFQSREELKRYLQLVRSLNTGNLIVILID